MQSNRTMKNHGSRTRYRAGWKALMVAAMALYASIADATLSIVPIEMPVVYVGAGDGSSGTLKQLDWMTDELRALIHAEASAPSASATSQIGIVDVHRAHSSGVGGAFVYAWMEFTVEDPQGRPQLKTILDFNAVAEAGAPVPNGPNSQAGVVVVIGQSDGSGVQLRVDNDTLSSEIIHTPNMLSELFLLAASGDSFLYNDANGQPVVPHTSCAGLIRMNGQVVSQRGGEGCASDSEKGSLDLTHAPGTYLMRVVVGANANGLAVSDPVWRPHPDYADVIITRHAPTGLPTALAGINPDDLVAQGIDPTPFIEAGFFDPPSSEPPPPPPPPPTPKYWCSPGFWLNNAVSFGAGAWPASERTYYDYNSTAGQRAGCPTATGNPTLLQVLQNPSGYFGTQLRGAGFNCVGDHLSGKSGLLGTMADNNGVCSIDQFGRQIQ
jgi:hypothetical protein